MVPRRTILFSSIAIATVATSAGLWRLTRPSSAQAAFEITKSPAEWRELLGENRFLVMRKEKTERQFSSDLLDEKRPGTYFCAACDLPVYGSEAKYESGTGWPSFHAALIDAVRTKEDLSYFIPRTEVHCRRCGGHFGHIFDDGPPPTGKRHCLNGLALVFRPA